MSISQQYDVIIVGARVAGSAAAIMLGRDRFSVLLLDKAEFPSDTLSTHIVLCGGAAVLAELGATEELMRLGAERFHWTWVCAGEVSFKGANCEPGDAAAGFCLRRFRMDHAMVEMARSLDQVTLREGFRVTDLIVEDGAIAGVRGEDASGRCEFRAPLVIGADGMRSPVAAIAATKLGAFARTDVPCARAYYYGYFSGVNPDHLRGSILVEYGPRPDSAYVAAMCDDGLAVFAAAFDAELMTKFRSDLATNFMELLNRSPTISPMLSGAELVSKVYSSGRLLNTHRVPVCNGALLLGDAGLHADPLFGQGHSLALISAKLACGAAPRWFGAAHGATIDAGTMTDFAKRRDETLGPYYESGLATSRILGLDQMTAALFKAAASEQWAADEAARFMGMAQRNTPFPSFRLARLIGRSLRHE